MKYATPPLPFAALVPRRHHAPDHFTKDTAQAQAALYRNPLDTTTLQPILRC